MALVYGTEKDGTAAAASDGGEEEDETEDFFRPLRARAATDRFGYPLDALDSTRLQPTASSSSSGSPSEAPPDWSVEGEDGPLEELKRRRFVTGGWGKEKGEEDEDEEAYGDYEDLETGEAFKGRRRAGGGDGGSEEDSEEEESSDEEAQVRAVGWFTDH